MSKTGKVLTRSSRMGVRLGRGWREVETLPPPLEQRAFAIRERRHPPPAHATRVAWYPTRAPIDPRRTVDSPCPAREEVRGGNERRISRRRAAARVWLSRRIGVSCHVARGGRYVGDGREGGGDGGGGGGGGRGGGACGGAGAGRAGKRAPKGGAFHARRNGAAADGRACGRACGRGGAAGFAWWWWARRLP